ncbi:MAG: hypothetical protein U9M90_00505 [Patescibacteria group bacterium]|nr:hypothetical protein [Patescibacteria group bacterium]
MGIKDIFKRKKDKDAEASELKNGSKQNYSEMLSNVDSSKLSFKERMGLKMFKRMSKKKQEKMLRQAMNPQEVMKNKDKLLKQVDDMVKSGQIDKGQAEAVKSRMGLR